MGYGDRIRLVPTLWCMSCRRSVSCVKGRVAACWLVKRQHLPAFGLRGADLKWCAQEDHDDVKFGTLSLHYLHQRCILLVKVMMLPLPLP